MKTKTRIVSGISMVAMMLGAFGSGLAFAADRTYHNTQGEVKSSVTYTQDYNTYTISIPSKVTLTDAGGEVTVKVTDAHIVEGYTLDVGMSMEDGGPYGYATMDEGSFAVVLSSEGRDSDGRQDYTVSSRLTYGEDEVINEDNQGHLLSVTHADSDKDNQITIKLGPPKGLYCIEPGDPIPKETYTGHLDFTFDCYMEE
jgi:hypothetical protein